MTDELRAECLELMATTDVVYLTTLGEDGHPRIRAMLNLRNREQYPDKMNLYGEGFMVYVSTNTSSTKRREIERDPRIGLYYCRPDEFFGLSMVGEAEPIDDPAVKEAVWVDWWDRYYPTGRPDDPDFTLYRLRPTRISGWHKGRKFDLEPAGS